MRVDVTVSIPDDRVAEFYTMLGAWLDPQQRATLDEQHELMPWGSHAEMDARDAKSIWPQLTTTARELLGVLMEAPGQRLTGEDLATRLGRGDRLNSHGVAGTLTWPTRRCAEHGRAPLVEWDEQSGTYFVTEAVATALRGAREFSAGK